MRKYLYGFIVLITGIFLTTGCGIVQKTATPQIKVFSSNSYQANYYLLYDEGQGVLIDAGANVDEITNFVKAHNIQVRYIMLSHGHYDHVTDAPKLAEVLGAELLLQEADEALFRETCGDANVTLIRGGEQFTVGKIQFDFTHTPGHTAGSVIIHTGNLLFTGDTLFRESVGRTDLPGGNEAALYTSIKDKILPYDDSTVILPGHGEKSTLGYERKNNPFLTGLK